MTDKPSSSLAPEGVNCCGTPLGKRCRQMWYPVPPSAVKYIHFPSGDHCAQVHEPIGPTAFPVDLPSNGIRRHCVHHDLSISAPSTHLPSGESADRWIMPWRRSAGTYTSRSSVRLRLEVPRTICMPFLIAEYMTWSLLAKLNPVALAMNSLGSAAPRRGISYVFHSNAVSICVNSTRLLSSENPIVCLRCGVRVSWTGSPSGNAFDHIWPFRVEPPKSPPKPRRNTSVLPSGEIAGICAASLKLVSCCHRSDGGSASRPSPNHAHNKTTAASRPANEPAISNARTRFRFPRNRKVLEGAVERPV